MGLESALWLTSSLQPWMRTTLLGEEKILIISTLTFPIKDRDLDRVRECLSLNLCKIRGLNKKRDNPLFKKPCFIIWLKMIRDWRRWSSNWLVYDLSCHKGIQLTSLHSLNQTLRGRIPLLKRTKHLRKLRFLLMGTQCQRMKEILTSLKVSILFPKRFKNDQWDVKFRKFLEVKRKVHINL